MGHALTGGLSGNGTYTQRCQHWLQRKTGVPRSFLTSSGTDALEMAAHLADLKPGDEVIMPSYTFSSTANAVVLRGAIPVFVDIRKDTLNIDERLIERAITPRTRAICPVHYAGVGCAMDEILTLARRHKLSVIEDAAQGVAASYRGRPLGSFGDFGAFSFHASKNIISGEGGALLVKNARKAKRAEIIWEKGTNRAQLIRGEVDKYTWVDIGSSFLMSEVSAALLWTQLQSAMAITAPRLRLWNSYHKALAGLEGKGLLRRPVIPEECQHNGHIYHILLPTPALREALRKHLRHHRIEACFHYVPLHSSPAGRRFGRTASPMSVTNRAAATLLRLPLFPGLAVAEQQRIIDLVSGFLTRSF
ncbi:MAG: dTDP-4-amino-4,6-dideoxygalactose transaminase [Pseudomonadota bacterium]|nr:dTDP-4-amino-4,6-dideoxygalactose transaminase [Pseudomonadota bacterium]